MIFGVQAELESHNRTINAFNRERKNHIKDKELTFQTIRNVVPASTWMIHCTHI